jgi:hypothetical protein
VLSEVLTIARLIFVCVALCASAASASPNIPLDDPIYDVLARLRALGELRVSDGGFRPVTDARGRALIGDRTSHDGVWLAPLRFSRIRLSATRENPRPYSTIRHPRAVAGSLALSCEHREGAPCENGAALVTELESALGYRDDLAGVVRLRGNIGTGAYDAAIDVERLYLNAEHGGSTAGLPSK